MKAQLRRRLTERDKVLLTRYHRLSGDKVEFDHNDNGVVVTIDGTEYDVEDAIQIASEFLDVEVTND
jgi:predicted RNA methylase